ncbi:MAG: hypothetical protein M3N51_03530 [Actinomycetota bacterium]|nr:hypothetical protein [Actinomycetota bacterium]
MNRPLLYLEHLSDADLRLLGEASGLGRDQGEVRSRLRQRPELIDELLGAPDLFERLVAVSPQEAFRVQISPFLTFAVLVHQVAGEVRGLDFVQEWTGPRQRLPVFDVASLQDFLDQPSHRFHLTELLASYTKVASGSYWQRTRRGVRRRRFSEMDLVQMASMTELAGENERAGLYRRLGDLSLFLTGVFPDHTARRRLSPREMERLGRVAGMSAGEILRAEPTAASPLGNVGLLEELGGRWYRLADQATAGLWGRASGVLGGISREFRSARRALNLLSDRHLFRFQADWFPPPPA